MKALLVANPKGGAGKTTISTNLAAFLAGQNESTLLWDLDRQKSSLEWLSLRPPELPRIIRLDDQDDGYKHHDKSWLVIDSPAGLHGKNLGHALKPAHKVLVPVQPSLFDMAATRDFLHVLNEEKAVRKHKAFIGIVGMRVDARTKAAATLEAFLAQFDLPVLTYLRDTQLYPNAAFTGRSIFDLPRYQSERDVELWQPILEWVLQDA
ncbi:MAG: ParA family protein [Pseudomonadota bacterium]